MDRRDLLGLLSAGAAAGLGSLAARPVGAAQPEPKKRRVRSAACPR